MANVTDIIQRDWSKEFINLKNGISYKELMEEG